MSRNGVKVPTKEIADIVSNTPKQLGKRRGGTNKLESEGNKKNKYQRLIPLPMS